MRIEQVIGAKIAAKRKEHGVSQDELGRQLGELLGKVWSRQAVWAAEQGKRTFTAVELVAFAYVLGVKVEAFMRPPLDIDGITMPSGFELTYLELIEPSTTPGYREALEEADNLAGVLEEATSSVAELKQSLDKTIRKENR
jgi:transcriptional regulator with XRE-family HTH domain